MFYLEKVCDKKRRSCVSETNAEVWKRVSVCIDEINYPMIWRLTKPFYVANQSHATLLKNDLH